MSKKKKLKNVGSSVKEEVKQTLIKHRSVLEDLIYTLIFFLMPFVFYIVAHYTYLFKDIKDEDIGVYLDAEKRYSAATKIWLLCIIVIILVIK